MKKPAFTLLELLVVITIMMLAIGFLFIDFNQARRNQELNLTVQQTLAMMDQSRAEVDSGKVNLETEAYLCLGAHFESGGVPEYVQMEFNSDLENCDFDTAEHSTYGIVQGAALVDKIDLDQGHNQVWAMFMPPEADLVFYDKSGSNFSGDGSITYIHTNDEDLSHELFFSSTTNRVTLVESDEE